MPEGPPTAPITQVLHTPDGAQVHLTVHRAPAAAASVLLLHGFAQNAAIFDVPGRSMVAALVDAGITAMVAQMRGRTQRVRAHGLGRYVFLDAPTLVAAAAAQANGPLIMVGHSMGALVAACLPAPASALLAGRVLVAPPFHFAPQLAALRAPLSYALGKTALHLPTRMAGPLLGALRGVVDVRWPRSLMATWAPGSTEPHVLAHVLAASFVDEPAGVLADLMSLGRGAPYAGRVPVLQSLAQLTGPALVLGGHADGLAVSSGVRRLYQALGTPDRTLQLYPGVGHVDILVGRSAPAVSWPAMLGFVHRVASDARPAGAHENALATGREGP